MWLLAPKERPSMLYCEIRFPTIAMPTVMVLSLMATVSGSDMPVWGLWTGTWSKIISFLNLWYMKPWRFTMLCGQLPGEAGVTGILSIGWWWWWWWWLGYTEHLHFDGTLLTVLYIIAFTHHRNLPVGLIISQICFRWGNWDPMKLNN